MPRRSNTFNPIHVIRGLFVCGLLLYGGEAWTQEPANPPADTTQTQQPDQTPAPQLPDAPSASKNPANNKTTGNPRSARQMQDKTRQAAAMTKAAAEASLKRARDWESGWITGIYVGKSRQLVPMTAQQRTDYFLRQTFTTPEAYMKRMFAAGVDQARGVPYQWDDGWTGYVERFTSREGQFFTSNSIAALGNAKLGYEVRYDKCKCLGIKPRLRHAIMRNFLTYDRSEENLHPQWALYGGAFGGGLVSTAWKPSPKNAWANGGWAVLGQAGYGALVNLITEFSTEINRKQGVKR